MEEWVPFLEQLSSAAPVPGGGSVAALEVALGASLLVMVANLTIGKKRFAGVEANVREMRSAAEAIRDRARLLAAEDVAAYGAVGTAMAMPRTEEHEREQRAAAIQQALKGAVTPPLTTMHLASRVLYLAADLLHVGNPHAVSDVGTAAAAAHAGYEGARLNVEINLAAITDAPWALDVRRSMDEIPAAGPVAQDILQGVVAAIQGAPA